MTALTPEQQERVTSELPLVNRITWKIMRKLGRSIEYDDIHSIGVIGLIDAARRFDPARNVPFGSFASHRILGEILDHLRAVDPMSRHQRKRVNRGEMVAYTTTSLEAKDTPLDITSQDQSSQRMLIAQGLKNLAGRKRFIIEQHFLIGYKLYEIAAHLGLSDSRVSQLKDAALADMRRALSIAEPARQPRRVCLEEGLSIHSPSPERCSESQPTLLSDYPWPEEAQL